jgi:hypothetical protein
VLFRSTPSVRFSKDSRATFIPVKMRSALSSICA